MEEMEMDHSSTIVEDHDNDWRVNGGGIFSDESSFYGPSSLTGRMFKSNKQTGCEETKAEYEKRVAASSPSTYWDVVQWNIQCLAAQAASSLSKGTKRKREDVQHSSQASMADIRANQHLPLKTRSKASSSVVSGKFYNPYEGEQSAKQMSETVDDFLSRLPPSITDIADNGPWIWVANPHSSHRATDEDVAGFKQGGGKALGNFLSRRSELEARHPNKTQAAITRLLNSDRDQLEITILELARKHGVTCGKWMLFPSPGDVDKIWSTIVRATVNNELGCGAKVATDDGDPNGKYRLICVYTVDFSNLRDVQRVLDRMRQIGLVGSGGDRAQTIYYKCDAYTHLDIASGNEYRLKASMYNSKAMSQ